MLRAERRRKRVGRDIPDMPGKPDIPDYPEIPDMPDVHCGRDGALPSRSLWPRILARGNQTVDMRHVFRD